MLYAAPFLLSMPMGHPLKPLLDEVPVLDRFKVPTIAIDIDATSAFANSYQGRRRGLAARAKEICRRRRQPQLIGIVYASCWLKLAMGVSSSAL